MNKRRKSKSKGKKVKVNENEATAKTSAKQVLPNKQLYKVYVDIMTLSKRASIDNLTQKIIKGNKVIFRGNKAEATLSANKKEVRLHYRSGMEKAYREKAPNEGTIAISQSGDLFTEKVKASIEEYLTLIFNKSGGKKEQKQEKQSKEPWPDANDDMEGWEDVDDEE